MVDPLSDIRSVSSDQAAQETELRSLFLDLQERIGKSLSDREISIQSSTVVFEEGGDGNAIYGFCSTAMANCQSPTDRERMTKKTPESARATGRATQ